MALPRYLAMTREEFDTCHPLPQRIAWMACHFSPYGTGIENLPPALPKHSMVILNDRIPMAGHDPETVLQQLRKLSPACLLLDFQRPPEPNVLDLTRFLVRELSCPVGVPPACGGDLDCPLLLPPLLPDTPAEEFLSPWKGREIWLEIAPDAMTYTVTERGSHPGVLSSIPESGQRDTDLCCHYRIDISNEQAIFSLWRTREDMENLAEKIQIHGVTKTVGLWQELGHDQK